MEYLENEIANVRLIAVRSCANLLESAAKSCLDMQNERARRRALRNDIQKLLYKLVALSVADPSGDVRHEALNALDNPLFHPYLLQPQVLQNLFLCFYDEDARVRSLAVRLGGRLSHRNPAHVTIALRKLLQYLIGILRTEHNSLAQLRKESTELLQLFIHEARPLVDYYSEPIMEVLISRLNFARKLNDKRAAETVLKAIGDLGGICSRVNLFSYCERIVPLLVAYILDDHGSDRGFYKTAIHAMFNIAQSTGYVIQPYTKFCRLLPGLLQLLSNESDVSLRLEIETLIGCLGAVDPIEHKDAALPSLTGSIMTSVEDIGVRSTRPNWAHRSATPASLNDAHSFPINSDTAAGSLRNRPLGMNPATPSNPGFPIAEQSPAQDIALFAVGPEKLEELTLTYTPVWAREMCEKVSLVGFLEHPFTASQDYFASIALDQIMCIVRSANRRFPCREAFDALVKILAHGRDRIPHFLPAIFPCLLFVLKPDISTETKPIVFSSFHEFAMARLAEIVSLSGGHVLPYVFDTVLLLRRYIEDSRFHPKCVISVCKLLIRIQVAIGDLFKPIIATLLSSLLEALSLDISHGGSMAEAVLHVFDSLGPMLNSYSAIVLQKVVSVVEHSSIPVLRQTALHTLLNLLHVLDLNEVISLVLHPLLRILIESRSNSTSPGRSMPSLSAGDRRYPDNLSHGAATAICVVARKSPVEFTNFITLAAKNLKKIPVGHRYEAGKLELTKLILRRNQPLVSRILDISSVELMRILNMDSSVSDLPTRRNSVGSAHSLSSGRINLDFSSDFAPPPENWSIPEHQLMTLWRIRKDFSEEDWTKWKERLEVGLIKCSGSPALRSCEFLFENYPKQAKALFNASFLSCWTTPHIGDGLSDSARREVVYILLEALASETMPLNLRQSILNLFEFMEHDERPLPASVEFLAKTAYSCGAFAKALRYKEGEYSVNTRSPCHKASRDTLTGPFGLMNIYEKLGHEESARGVYVHYENVTNSILNEHSEYPERLEGGGEEQYSANFEDWAKKLSGWEEFRSNTLWSKEEREMKPVVSDNERIQAFSILRDEPVTSPHWSFLIKKLKGQNDVGKWRSTAKLVREIWGVTEGNNAGRQLLLTQGRGISVAFDLSNWEEFEDRIRFLGKEHPYLTAFYKCMGLVRRGRDNPELLTEAEEYLAKARSALDVHITARLSEGYPRAYMQVVNAQTLVELEEMINYLRTPPSKREFARHRLLAIWDQRLVGCKYDDYVWYRLLMIRALVIPPMESKTRWIEFSSLCRKNGRLPLASEALRMLVLPSLPDKERKTLAEMPVENMPSNFLRDIKDLDIRYAVCRHLWASGRESDAFSILKDSVTEYRNASVTWRMKEPSYSTLTTIEPESLGDRKEVMVAAEVLLKLAKWGSRLVRMGVENTEATESLALDFARNATQMRANFVKPWHWWGLLNCERARDAMDKAAKERGTPEKGLVMGVEARMYLTNAVDGFFKSIKLGGNTRLEDSLKVLTLWFKFGSVALLHKVFDRGFEDTVITGWLKVVPQIIARLHTSNRNVQAGIEHLLTRIGNEHPQIVVYNLIVAKATQSPQHARREAATRVLNSIRRKHANIVMEAEMVARELVRVAVLWGELWYEKLEEASRLYFGEKDLDSMLQCIYPMHQMIERGPETSYEKSFMELYGRELNEAGKIIKQIYEARQKGVPVADLEPKSSKLWEFYYYVFGRIQKQQYMMNALDLTMVSQWLKNARNLEIAVPGTYDPAKNETVTVHSFGSLLRILQSKQRPRKLDIHGSDGITYNFLLKGHEDLRQDERVMQVFGLINQIMAFGQERSIRRGADIKRYSVIALSNNAGLIEWVPNCDTMHALVKEHREVRKVMPNIEHKVMTRVAPEPDRLPLLHKVDIFKFMLSNTSGSDIARVLWLKSRSSEVWLDRRTTYARSLASSSMAGYLLGLGDRHPSNLMMDRATGKIMHIDFGDCFEVAMVRDKYPENVPFRLTRMLVNALEPCGVDGYFRHTCEAVLRALREPTNRESLLSMMEAFVYDPLLRMKLVGGEELQRLREEGNRVSVVKPNFYHTSAVPVVSESLQIRLLSQEGSLHAAHAYEMGQSSAQAAIAAAAAAAAAGVGANEDENNPPGAIATGNAPAQSSGGGFDYTKSPSRASRRERDRLLRVVPADKCNEVADERAAIALQRVKDKLHGKDFRYDIYGEEVEKLNTKQQVELLINEATSEENLCSLFTGWCAFW